MFVCEGPTLRCHCMRQQAAALVHVTLALQDVVVTQAPGLAHKPQCSHTHTHKHAVTQAPGPAHHTICSLTQQHTCMHAKTHSPIPSAPEGSSARLLDHSSCSSNCCQLLPPATFVAVHTPTPATCCCDARPWPPSGCRDARQGSAQPLPDIGPHRARCDGRGTCPKVNLCPHWVASHREPQLSTALTASAARGAAAPPPPETHQRPPALPLLHRPHGSPLSPGSSRLWRHEQPPVLLPRRVPRRGCCPAPAVLQLPPACPLD